MYNIYDTLKDLRGVQIPNKNYLNKAFLHLTLLHLIIVHFYNQIYNHDNNNDNHSHKIEMSLVPTILA